MSNFKQNTVETVGDAALAESIIDKSITELHCNITTSIAAQKFRGCSGLTNVIFPSVTSVGIGAFWQCTALKQADFSACVSFAQNAFYGCSALEALILRSDAVCSLTGTGNLSGTKIASGTGYIYVPSALVDTYKAASGWSTYAAQIRAIEDYPAVCNWYTWDAVFASIDNGSYASVYSVGDTVPLDLGSEGVVNMQIAAIDADDLADGSGKAPISWISKELLATVHRMNPKLVQNADSTYQEGTGCCGGWEKCEMRAYLQNTIKPLIPGNVSARIKTVTKTQKSIDVSTTTRFTQTTQDDVWIPDYNEINESSGIYYNILGTENDRKKKQNGSAIAWWLRSTYSYSTNAYRFVNYVGSNKSSQQAEINSGIALGFCT